MTFGKNLQTLRRQNGLSQQQLAEQLGVSRQAVSKWELDAAKPDIDNVIQISRLFGVSIDELLTGEVFRDARSFPQPVDTNRGKPGKRFAGAVLILAGVVCMILAGFAAVWMQSVDRLAGSWYTEAMEYLWHFPVIAVVAVAAVCLLAGLVLLLSSIPKE
ncbi:helix-turn-helix domain-containing protein [Butyricicoccus sp.]|uniref:helix-turn-helix domain-containing protein n=1 Tax=Butyricicoccus sp. TaxID=2049021 RepID=UPI003F16AC95